MSVDSHRGASLVLQLVYISTSRQPLDAQALEGPEGPVRATFNRIARDPRHFAIVELNNREIANRQFGDWAMAYNAGGEAGEDTDLREVVRKLIGPLADRDLRAQFTGFAEIHARAA